MITSEDLQKQRLAIQKTIAPGLISEPLKSKVKAWLDASASGAQPPSSGPYQVIIEMNHDHPGTRANARRELKELIETVVQGNNALRRNQDDATHPYIFAELTVEQILAVLEADGENALNHDMRAKESMVPNPPAVHDIIKPVPHRYLRLIFRIWEAQKLTP